jgi:phosphatidate cytidylyltransferase
MLDIPGFEGRNANLLMFLVLVAQMSDVLQYVWGKLTGPPSNCADRQSQQDG